MMFPTLLADIVPVTESAGASAGLTVHPIDLVIVIVYLVGIVLLGCWAGLRRKEAKGSDYFLAGRSLRWPMIGLALFATNISTIHLVSLAESGYTSGLLYGNFEWMAGFTLVILALFFAPFYIRANVTTLPDFLEKRYNRSCRDWLAVLSIFSAVVVHIGFSLYTGAVVLEGSLLGAFVENPENYRLVTIIAIAGATALYTIIGGLMAVVLTESIQTIVLLVGAICITLLGLNMIGGWNELKTCVHPVNFAMCRPDTDPTGLSWYAVLTGYWIAGIWYWCTDQTIVQRVLGAKDENNARIGPLFAGFIKILPVFIFVLPGLICLGLINKGIIPALPLMENGAVDSGKTYSHLIRHILPIGAQGLVIAALLAALMSTVSGALNSIATLVSYDIYKRFAPDTSDRTLITVGRIATFVAMVVAVVWSLAIASLGKTIFQAMVDVFCAVAPPTTVVFVWGVFWRRASAKAALITLVFGSVIGAVVVAISLLGLNKIGDYEINSLLSLFLLAVLESIILVVCSFIFPQKHTAESESLVWRSPLDALRGESGHWLLNYRAWVVTLLIVMVGLYIYWSGDQNYYPMTAKVTLADGTPVAGAKLTFDCDEPQFRFSQTTDDNGTFEYGTKAAAGGALVGTYRVKIEPQDKVVVSARVGNGQEAKTVERVLAFIPHGAPVEKKVLDNAKQLVIDLGDDEADYKVIDMAKDQKFKIVPGTPIPAKYETFDASGLQFTVGPKRTQSFQVELDTPVSE